MARLATPSQNDKEIHTVPNNRHQKLRSLLNIARDLHACTGDHTWPSKPNAYFTTKISKLSLVACVQHLLCWTHSICSLCTAHVLLISFVTTFTNYLPTCLTIIFTYVVLVQTHNSQNIHKGELWTCDNNELTHHLRSKYCIFREFIYFIFRDCTMNSTGWPCVGVFVTVFWL